MSTFPPKKCGIATFTQDLTMAMDKKFNPKIKSKILAMDRNSTSFPNYPDNVIFQINRDNIQEYSNIAKKINEDDGIKLVNIQHEFGIFGGEQGKNITHFVENLNKPLGITFHSVSPNPDDERKEIVRSISKKASFLIVMNKFATEILRKDYGVDTDIAVIPHGVHPVEFDTRKKENIDSDYNDKITLLSFGFIRKGKGYEYIIEALPEVIKRFPKLSYLIIGGIHPNDKNGKGENYKNFLEQKAKDLHLQNHVKIRDKYLNLSEVINYIKAADIYIAPQLNPNQITSGTISYAMGCGKVVISTPTLHAKEMITPERGLLTKFRNSKSFSDAIIKILSNPSLKAAMEKNSYAFTRNMTWPSVAKSHMDLFNKYVEFS